MGSWLGRKWPAPVWRPMWPFAVAGSIVFYYVNSFSVAVGNSAEFKNDPRNPNRQVDSGSH